MLVAVTLWLKVTSKHGADNEAVSFYFARCF